MLECLCNKVAGLQDCSFIIKERLQHRCFPVKLAKFLRTPILKSICEWQLPMLSIVLNVPNVDLLTFVYFCIPNEYCDLQAILADINCSISTMEAPEQDENYVQNSVSLLALKRFLTFSIAAFPLQTFNH